MRAKPLPEEESPGATCAYSFRVYRFDCGTGVLTTASGEQRVLRSKTAAVLRYLLENCGRAVSRDEVKTALWSGIFVTDDSLTQCVVELRRAFGEPGRDLIRTLAGRGYVFDEQVVRLPGGRPSAQQKGSAFPSPTEAPAGVDHPAPLRPSLETAPMPPGEGVASPATVGYGAATEAHDDRASAVPHVDGHGPDYASGDLERRVCEVVLRNGRVLRVAPSADPTFVARLATALEA